MKTRKQRFFDKVLGPANARYQQGILIAYKNKETLTTRDINKLAIYRAIAQDHKVHSDEDGWKHYNTLVSTILDDHEQPTPEPERDQSYTPISQTALAI